VSKSVIRETVLRSLSAVGATQEAKFYADLFAQQDPERFALIVLDPRCLKNPLLEALVSNLLILSELRLYPILLLGALDDDKTALTFQSQRLAKALETASIRTAKLNTASYGLIPEVRRKTRDNIIPILEMTDRHGGMTLPSLITDIQPNKVIFLQPSGGLNIDGRRVGVINIENISESIDVESLSAGQHRFVNLAVELARDGQADVRQNEARGIRVYVIASPLNLLSELFTTKGSGTMLRHAAHIIESHDVSLLDKVRLHNSIDIAFGKTLRSDFFTNMPHRAFIESQYRGGAIFTQLSGLSYLSKFWVIQEAQGEGIARDIWEHMRVHIPSFFWRSRVENPFNDWYMRECDGMQISGDWRVFWKGVPAHHVPDAILAASDAADDFTGS